MEIHPDCVPCVLKRVLFEARMVDSSKEREVLENVLKILSKDFQKGAVSAEVATKIHGKVYEILGTDDPYHELKERSNKVAEKLLPKAKKLVEKEGFRGAVLASIAGNVLDFGYRDDMNSPECLESEFDDIIAEGLGWDDIDEIENLVKEGKNIIFFTDNTGEVVFDTLLMKKIKEYDIDLTVVVKGEPILTDATMEDAVRYNIDEIADQLETTGGYAVGVDFSKLDPELLRKLDETDLIIAKGMANWESFSEKDYRPIAFLTRSKCEPISKTMGVPYDVNVAKLFQ
ncbi:MAG: damage-control phosphatase ARMT1 family protein [Candidatus Saliniplasma sp.]